MCGMGLFLSGLSKENFGNHAERALGLSSAPGKHHLPTPNWIPCLIPPTGDGQCISQRKAKGKYHAAYWCCISCHSFSILSLQNYQMCPYHQACCLILPSFCNRECLLPFAEMRDTTIATADHSSEPLLVSGLHRSHRKLNITALWCSTAVPREGKIMLQACVLLPPWGTTPSTLWWHHSYIDRVAVLVIPSEWRRDAPQALVTFWSCTSPHPCSFHPGGPSLATSVDHQHWG